MDTFSKRANLWWPMVMFAHVLDLAAHCIWAMEFDAESLAKKDAWRERFHPMHHAD